jgi:hypothetical protein
MRHELGAFEKVFLGQCMGVGLDRRGVDDPHVCFALLVEDDGNWFAQGESHSSSFWLPELIEVLQEAHAWLEKHGEPDGEDGKHGFRFKGARVP